MSITGQLIALKRQEEERSGRRYYELLWKENTTDADVAELRKCAEILRISIDQLSKDADEIRQFLSGRAAQKRLSELSSKATEAQIKHEEFLQRRNRIMDELKVEGCQLVAEMQQAAADRERVSSEAAACYNLRKSNPKLFELAPE